MIIKQSEFFKSAPAAKDYPDEILPEIAFAGKSNVGKSTLLNTILNRRKLAKTSGRPGRTQLINFFTINQRFFFVDLPGYGYAKVSKDIKKTWGKMMEDYFRSGRDLRCVILLLDIRRLITEDDLVLVKFLNSLEIPVVYILTKSDKVSNNEIFTQKQKLKKVLGDYYEQGEFITFSALSKRGKDDILKTIGNYLSEE